MNENNVKNNRNGKIELYRFVFCIIIVLFHIGEHFVYGSNYMFGDRFDLTFFAHGMIGVEFFFLVSGYLMAKYVANKIKKEKKKISSKELSKEWVMYLKKKIGSLFPQHTIAFVITFICAIIQRNYGIVDSIRCLLSSIPQFFFLQMSGITVNHTYPNNVEWYISAMLIGIAIIYPLLRKYYDTFSKMVAPMLGVFLLGIIINHHGYISGTIVWNDYFMIGTLRAIAMLCFGVCSYNIASIIQKKKYNKMQKSLLNILEIFSLISVILYINSDLSKKYEIIFAILIMVIVTLGFSEKTFLYSKLNNKFCYFLGKISLPIYLCHLGAINIIKRFFMPEPFFLQTIYTLIVTIIFTFITYWGGKLLICIKNKITV